MPVLLMPAGNDADLVKPDGEGATAIRKSGGESVLFADMLHGWVSRGDLNEPNVKRDTESAMA